MNPSPYSCPIVSRPRRGARLAPAIVCAILLFSGGAALDVRAADKPDTPGRSAAQRASLLFSAGFAGATLRPVDQRNCWPKGCWQDIDGTNAAGRRYTPHSTWPPNLWGGSARFQLIADVPVVAGDIGGYMSNRIQGTTGHTGKRTQALYSEISRGPDGRNPIRKFATQNTFQLLPEKDGGDLYVSFWLRLQPDLVQQMSNLPDGPGTRGGGTWRALFGWKTGTPGHDDGDYRVAAYVMTYGGGEPYWAVGGDNVAGGNYPLVNAWSVESRGQYPVPAGNWFKFEAFWHRSSDVDGRVWMAVDGNVIADHSGPNTGYKGMGINRIYLSLYSGSRLPISQWVDDVQIWDGFPDAQPKEPWYDPPYAPH
jgi:hypothetical protein